MSRQRVTIRPPGASPAKDYEPDDPFALVGQAYPVPSGPEADREMARCFIEEYALMGVPADQVRELFTSPAYAGPHGILRRRGRPFVEELLAQVYGGR